MEHRTCLYTKHKHQKRKTWHDGKLTIHPSSNRFTLHNTSSSITSEQVTSQLDGMESTGRAVRDVISGHLEDLEFERYLVQITGPWIVPPSVSSLEKTNTNTNTKSVEEETKNRNGRIPNGVDKLLKRKFRIPSKIRFVPKPIHHSIGNNGGIRGRKRPLQPGEWERICATGGSGGTVGNSGIGRGNGGNGGGGGGADGGRDRYETMWNTNNCGSVVADYSAGNGGGGDRDGNVSNHQGSTKRMLHSVGTLPMQQPPQQHQQPHQQPHQQHQRTVQNQTILNRNNGTSKISFPSGVAASNSFVSNDFNPSSFYEEEEDDDDDNDNNGEHGNAIHQGILENNQGDDHNHTKHGMHHHHYQQQQQRTISDTTTRSFLLDEEEEVDQPPPPTWTHSKRTVNNHHPENKNTNANNGIGRDPIVETDRERESQHPHKCTNDTLSKMELLQFFGCGDGSGGNHKATSSSHGTDETGDDEGMKENHSSSNSIHTSKNDGHGRRSYQSNQLHRHNDNGPNSPSRNEPLREVTSPDNERGDDDNHNEASENPFLDSLLRSEAVIDDQLTKRNGMNAVVNRKEVSDGDGDIPILRESSSDEVGDGGDCWGIGDHSFTDEEDYKDEEENNDTDDNYDICGTVDESQWKKNDQIKTNNMKADSSCVVGHTTTPEDDKERGEITEEDERVVNGETVGTGEIFRSRESMNGKCGSSVSDNYSCDGGNDGSKVVPNCTNNCSALQLVGKEETTSSIVSSNEGGSPCNPVRFELNMDPSDSDSDPDPDPD